MRLPWLIVCLLLTCVAIGCGASKGASPVATPTPRVVLPPTARPVTGSSATASPRRSSESPPFSLYSQERAGPGEYQLVNTLTQEFVEVTANGVRRVCERRTIGLH
jgi:hypothetical protein